MPKIGAVKDVFAVGNELSTTSSPIGSDGPSVVDGTEASGSDDMSKKSKNRSTVRKRLAVENSTKTQADGNGDARKKLKANAVDVTAQVMGKS